MTASQRQAAIRSLYESASMHTVILDSLGAHHPEIPMFTVTMSLGLLGVERSEIVEALEVLDLQYTFDVSPDRVGDPS